MLWNHIHCTWNKTHLCLDIYSWWRLLILPIILKAFPCCYPHHQFYHWMITPVFSPCLLYIEGKCLSLITDNTSSDKTVHKRKVSTLHAIAKSWIFCVIKICLLAGWSGQKVQLSLYYLNTDIHWDARYKMAQYHGIILAHLCLYECTTFKKTILQDLNSTVLMRVIFNIWRYIPAIYTCRSFIVHG